MKIRRLEKQDLEYANELRNKYFKYLRQPYPHNIKDQYEWFNKTKDLYLIINYNDKRCGIVGLTNIDLINRKAELSLITNDYLDIKIADILIDYIEKYAFEKLSLHKLFITAYDFDLKKNEYFSKRYKKGFEINDDVFFDSNFYNQIYYYLLDNEWRNK